MNETEVSLKVGGGMESEVVVPRLTFQAPRDKLGSSNAVLVKNHHLNSFDFFIPGYLKLKVNNLSEINLANRFFKLEVEIHLSLYFGAIPYLIASTFKESLVMRIGHNKCLQLKNTHNQDNTTISIEERVSDRLFIYKIFTDVSFSFLTEDGIFSGLRTSVRFSPFEKISSCLTIHLQRLEVKGNRFLQNQDSQDESDYVDFLKKIGCDPTVEEELQKKFTFSVNLMDFQGADLHEIQSLTHQYNQITQSYDRIRDSYFGKKQPPFDEHFRELQRIYSSKAQIRELQDNESIYSKFHFESPKLTNHYQVIMEEVNCYFSHQSREAVRRTVAKENSIVSKASVQEIRQIARDQLLKLYSAMNLSAAIERKMCVSAHKGAADRSPVEFLAKVLGKMERVWVVSSEFNKFVAYDRKSKRVVLVQLQTRSCLWKISLSGTKCKLENCESPQKTLSLELGLNKQSDDQPGVFPISPSLAIDSQKVSKVSFYEQSGWGHSEMEHFFQERENRVEEQRNLFQNCRYAHFEMSLYKKPGVPLLILFLPLLIIASVNLAIFFTEHSLTERVENVATLLIAYMAFFPVFRSQIPPYEKLLASEVLIYVQIICSVLAIVDTLFAVSQGEEGSLVRLKILFWISVSLTALSVVSVVVFYLGFKFCVEKNWRDSRKRAITNSNQASDLEEHPEVYHLYNNYESDFAFYRSVEMRTLLNVMAENILRKGREPSEESDTESESSVSGEMELMPSKSKKRDRKKSVG